MADDTLKALRAAARGLLFPSESDKPVKAFVWKSDDAPEEALHTAGKIPAEATIKEVPMDDFFATVTKAQPWYGDEEKARTRQFQALVALLKEKLADIKVFRVTGTDSSRIDVYVVGRTATGDIGGVHTQLIET